MTGLDPSEALVALARSHSAQMSSPPVYEVSTVEEHAQHNMAAYDVVIASEVIEHVGDKESFLAASIAALKVWWHLFNCSIVGIRLN